ncbi:MAG TPA: SpoIVB peptidase S55 domain-containing protein [Thermoanaerobaculia bacterium]|nr:SpoIVB peptidase S55 domain-containing protein [Thermoanaerobaculia bacterium]
MVPLARRVLSSMGMLARGVAAAAVCLSLCGLSPVRPVPPAPVADVKPTEILPVDQIVPGMKGYGVTDLGDGQGVQRFEVEIIGLLKRYAPRQDLVLGRVSGAGLENAGIIAGMSGSPIYVEGKLVGALAYGWPFSKDPICGITPIQSMLDIRHVPAGPPVPIGGSTGSATSTSALLSAFSAGRFSDRLESLLAPLRLPAAGEATPLPLPVSFGGTSAPGELFSRVAQAAGWMAVPSGASGAGASAEPSSSSGTMRPGSAIAAQLLSGDMDLSATGTVTWVEGNSVLAFGHPFLSMGPVSMPMARAEVLTVLPSVYRSFKFAATGPVLGSISQDRSTGILGMFGARAPMVPITVRISSDQVPMQTYHFQAVHNAMLTPILAAVAIDNVVTTLEKRAGERTLVWKSAIHTTDRDIQWNSVFSGMTAREEAVASLALLTNYLMANEFRDLTITGIDVEIAHSDRLQNARIVHVEAQKERVRAGEDVPIWVDVVDFRGSSRRVVMNLKVPADTPEGPLTVFVGDGSAATAYDLGLLPADPHSLDQVLDFIARIRPPNSLNLLAYRKSPGAVVVGDTLPALPPSLIAILRDRGPGEQATPDLSYVRLQSESIEQPIPVTGSARLRVDVEPKIW